MAMTTSAPRKKIISTAASQVPGTKNSTPRAVIAATSTSQKRASRLKASAARRRSIWKRGSTSDSNVSRCIVDAPGVHAAEFADRRGRDRKIPPGRPSEPERPRCREKWAWLRPILVRGAGGFRAVPFGRCRFRDRSPSGAECREGSGCAFLDRRCGRNGARCGGPPRARWRYRPR